MDEFQKMAAKAALKDMFENKNYFSICTVDKLIKLTGCIPNKKDYEALNALHCIHWMDMGQELRSMAMMKTLQIFEQPGFDTEVLDSVFSSDPLKLLN